MLASIEHEQHFPLLEKRDDARERIVGQDRQSQGGGKKCSSSIAGRSYVPALLPSLSGPPRSN
jgi:hypothetical protein